ncbi:MAG: hypothetical protein ACM34D_04800, partial [Gemmatimonadota bacterium]
MVPLGQGDLAGAQAVVRAGLTAVEPAALLAYFGSYQDLYWVLDDTQQQQLLALPPSAFDNDRGAAAIVRTQTYYLHGDQAKARVYADSARLAYEEQLRATPDDGQQHVLRGLMLAPLGCLAEAIRAGERAAALWPISRDADQGGLHPAPARADLPAGGRAGEGARPTRRAAAQDALFPLARLAPDRSDVRAAQGHPTFERLAAGK